MTRPFRAARILLSLQLTTLLMPSLNWAQAPSATSPAVTETSPSTDPLLGSTPASAPAEGATRAPSTDPLLGTEAPAGVQPQDLPETLSPVEFLPPTPATPLDMTSLEGAPISALRVDGNLKIEQDAIIAVLATRQGDAYSTVRIRSDVKAIYGLGYFRDVQVDVSQKAEGLQVTYRVVEKPSVRAVRVEGNEKVEKDDIQEVITLKLFSILNQATIAEDVQRIKDVYAEKGYYLADVSSEVRAVSENEVEVLFKVKENDKVLVKRIYFLGAEKLKDSEFRNFLTVKEGGFLPSLTQSGTFNEEQLENDAMIVQAFYNEKGYIQARVDPPTAYMSADRKSIFISYKVYEGDRYKIGEIDVTGELIDSREKLLGVIKTATGDWFSRSSLGTDIQALTDFYSDEGYAFANVVPIPDIDDTTKTVKITFDVEKGARIDLDQIRISGNSVTWDKTIRREVPLLEGEMYRGGRMREGKRRLERLGYFEEVKMSTPKAGSSNALNMDVEVTEKPTGTFNIGAGFSTFESFILTVNISKQNFLGLGYVMGAAANVSATRQQYNLSFYDPYLGDTRWTLRGDAYNIDTSYSLSESRRGADLALGHYLGSSDDSRFALKYTFENVGMTGLSESWRRYRGGELFRGGDVSSIEASLTVDKRNNRITPTSGYLLSLSSELAGGFEIGDRKLLSLLGGDFNYHRHQFNFRLYVPLYPKVEDLLVFRVNTTLGGIFSTDGRILPVIQRYRAGGINSVRGYGPYTLGPTARVTTNDNPNHRDDPLVIGGYQIFNSNIELEFAILKSAGIRGVVFFDAGNGFDLLGFDQQASTDEVVILSDGFPRISTGFGVRWFSPMGPLRFEWGFPLTPRENDQSQVFEFTIGSFF
ncbi:MAG: outer membrane protein assembly factor BamA [Myxococcota bacterium]